MNKKVGKINKKKIKTRRTWNINPTEQIVPNKRIEDKKFNDNILRGQNITEEDLDYIDDIINEEFERGFHD